MSLLSEEIYAYLEKSKRRMQKSRLQTKFGVNNAVMNGALEELGDRLKTCRESGKMAYYVDQDQQAHTPAAPFVMRPYNMHTPEWARVLERLDDAKSIKTRF